MTEKLTAEMDLLQCEPEHTPHYSWTWSGDGCDVFMPDRSLLIHVRTRFPSRDALRIIDAAEPVCATSAQVSTHDAMSPASRSVQFFRDGKLVADINL